MFRVFHLLDEKKKQRSDVKRLPLFVKTAIYNQKKSRPTGGFFFWQREAGEPRRTGIQSCTVHPSLI